MAMTNQRKAFQGIRMENPFALKVFQVFTGFGFGCGVGIGYGSPLNLGIVLFTQTLNMCTIYLSFCI